MLLLFYSSTDVSVLHSPADVLRYWLIQEGLGSLPPSLEWPIHVSEPASPDNCITVKGTAGVLQGRMSYNGEYEEKPGVQVRVRARTHNEAWRKAVAIALALDQDLYDDYVTVDSARYLLVSAKRTSNVLPIGFDSPTTKRSVCTVNALLCTERVS